ncbi:hypothetical protein GT50_18385 [Geobacillus stearothermophilus 10]|nr:hypothetical protein GT50_18385 [Geobacillus stearothermophilus 10]
MDRQNILEVSNVSKVFKWKDKTIRAVNQVSFHLTEKAIIGISGRNGSGKTTLLKLIAGLLIPDEGNVMLFGQPLNDRNAKENVSILLEGSRSFYWNLRGRENLEYFCQLNKIRNMKKEIDNMIELLRLDTFIDNLTGSYSRGMQQKLSLAIALLSKPKLLILDEPTNGLDYESKVQLSKILQQLVSELGISILIVCHESVFLQSTVNHILIMEKGAIVESLKINKTDFNFYDFVSFEFSGSRVLINQ